jgi:putative transposase
VERNPMRAGIVASAAEYRWSSAAAHVDGADEAAILDMEWWWREGRPNWAEAIGAEDLEASAQLRSSTYAGRPCGSEEFLRVMGARFGRHWVRGRPRKESGGELQMGQEESDRYSLVAGE